MAADCALASPRTARRRRSSTGSAARMVSTGAWTPSSCVRTLSDPIHALTLADYIDSNIPEIHVFDYDIDTGLISNRRVFATAPPDAGDGVPTKGVFDGLVVDGVGNVWSARWGDSRVVAYSPEGELLLHIRTPGAKSPTIPAFGGKDLTTVYVATASANLAGEGDIQAQWPASGDVFKIEAGEGTPLGTALGKSWKGRVRHAFGG